MNAQSIEGIAILLWASEPEAPHRLATPFFHAAAAGAMDVPVEIYFTARSVQLLVPGVAEKLRAGDHEKTIAACISEAATHGAKLFACTDALKAHKLEHHTLIQDVAGHGGAVQFMARVCDPKWRALVF
jgi:uncharacterized protein